MRRTIWALILIPLLIGSVVALIVTIQMSGTFTVVGLACSPCAVQFGSVTLGGSPTNQTFTLTNTFPSTGPTLTLSYTVTAPTGITLRLLTSTVGAGVDLGGRVLTPGSSVTVTASLSASSSAALGAGTLTWSISGN